MQSAIRHNVRAERPPIAQIGGTFQAKAEAVCSRPAEMEPTIRQHHKEIEVAIRVSVSARAATEQPNGVRLQLENEAITEKAKGGAFASEGSNALGCALLQEALPALRDLVKVGEFNPTDAAIEYMKAHMGDEVFDAWIFRGGTNQVLQALTKAAEKL